MIQKYFTTFKELAIQPRRVIDQFIQNGETGYLHPFRFFLSGAIILTLLYTLWVSFPNVTAVSNALDEPVQAEQIVNWIEIATVRLSTQFFPVMLVLLIPLLSVSGLFFFRNEMDGFYSHLIMNSYAAGASMPVLLAAIPFWMFLDIPFTDPFMNTTVPAIPVAAMTLWVYKNYLKLPGLTGLLKKLSVFITGYLLFLFLKGFISGVTGYTLFALSRIRDLSGL